MPLGAGRSGPGVGGDVADRTASGVVRFQCWAGEIQLHELLIEDRTALIDRWRDKVRASLAPKSLPEAYVIDSLPRFLDELVEALRGTQIPKQPSLPNLSLVASEHGTQRLKLGFDVGAVVREYGLLADAILELAAARKIAVTSAEARSFANA